MQIINVGLFSCVLVLQIFYAKTWDGINYGVIIVTISRGIAVLFIKCTFLLLVSMFGQSAIVKSHIMSNNDLLIVGTDKSGKLLFQLRVKRRKCSDAIYSTADRHSEDNTENLETESLLEQLLLQSSIE